MKRVRQIMSGLYWILIGVLELSVMSMVLFFGLFVPMLVMLVFLFWLIDLITK